MRGVGARLNAPRITQRVREPDALGGISGEASHGAGHGAGHTKALLRKGVNDGIGTFQTPAAFPALLEPLGGHRPDIWRVPRLGL